MINLSIIDLAVPFTIIAAKFTITCRSIIFYLIIMVNTVAIIFVTFSSSFIYMWRIQVHLTVDDVSVETAHLSH